jgi:hypothetical protein
MPLLALLTKEFDAFCFFCSKAAEYFSIAAEKAAMEKLFFSASSVPERAERVGGENPSSRNL